MQVDSAVAVASSVLASRSLSCWDHPQPASLHCGNSVRVSAVHMCVGQWAKRAGLWWWGHSFYLVVWCLFHGGCSCGCQHRTQRSFTTHSQSATRRPACPQPPNLSFSRPLTYELSHSRLLRVHICSNLRPLLLPKTDGQRARYLKVFSVGGILSPCLSGPPLSAQGLYCSNRPFLGCAT